MIFIIMGVCGTGKTTLGKALATSLSSPFLEGDDFHSPKNKEKLASGIALSDEDRKPWLIEIAKNLRNLSVKHKNLVLSCSALKEQYRSILNRSGETHYIFLNGPYEVLYQRLLDRQDHFMAPSLLDSQIKTLEKPKDNFLELSIILDTQAQIEKIIESCK